MHPTYVDSFTREVLLNPHDTALVIVDMQYASGSREHGLGRLLAQQGALDSAAERFDRIEQVIIPNNQKLLTCFRALGAPVVFVTLGPQQPDYSDAPVHLRKWFEATHNHAGTREHEVVDELKPLAGELVLNKTTIGAFTSTAIDTALRGKGISNIVVTGVSTNNCVGMTAMQAADLQYGVAMVSDATGTCSEAMQASTLASFRRLWGKVVSTEQVITEMHASAGASGRSASA